MDATEQPTKAPDPRAGCLAQAAAQFAAATGVFEASKQTWTDYLDFGVALNQIAQQYNYCIRQQTPTGV